MSIFGKNLRALRESKGMSQGELSKKVGISRASINQYENKGYIPTKTGTKKALCEALDCTESDLFGYADGAAARSCSVYELVNMCDINDNNPKDINGESEYPVNKAAINPNKKGVYQEITSKINESKIMSGSHAYFEEEKNIKDYSDHICLMRINDNLICSRIHIFDNTIVLLKRDSKDVYDLDKVEIIGRCVWFEHFERGL